MFNAAISGRRSRMWAMRSSGGMPTAPVEKLMITSVRARTSAKISAKVSTLQSGAPSGLRAWMCTMAAPASAARLASSPISLGAYGMAGHCSRVANTPVRAAVITLLLISGPRELTAKPRSSWGISYGDVAVLAPRPVDPLVARLLDAVDDHAPGLGRIDDVVDHRPPGGDVRADLRPDGFDHLRPRLLGAVRSFDLFVEDDVDGALGAHDRNLRERPGHEEVGLVALAAHHVVPRPVGLAHDDRDLRHRRLRGRIQHLGPVADDPVFLDLGADQESRHVHQVHERDVEGVAHADEPSGFVGRVRIEDAALLHRLVRDHAHRVAAGASKPDDDVLWPRRLDFEPLLG